MTSLPLFSPPESVLCLFAVALAYQGLAPQTISFYLAGIRNLKISQGGSLVNWAEIPHLLLTLRGINSSPQRNGGTKRPQRLPIIRLVMHQLNRVGWFVLWATACVGLFGFIRVGEFMMVYFSSPLSICVQDMAVKLRYKLSTIRLHL